MSVDRILEVLDGGLQRSSEPSYGTDFDQSQCARCRQHEHVADGDLCSGCRVFLLGDTDFDPKTGVGPVVLHVPVVRFDIEASEFRAAFDRVNAACAATANDLARRLARRIREFVADVS